MMLFREKFGTLLPATDRLLWLPKCSTCCRGPRSSCGGLAVNAPRPVPVCTEHRFRFSLNVHWAEFLYTLFCLIQMTPDPLSVLPCFNCKTKTTFVCLIKCSVVIWTVSPVNVPIFACIWCVTHTHTPIGVISLRCNILLGTVSWWSRGIQTHLCIWPHPQQEENSSRTAGEKGRIDPRSGALLDLFGCFNGSERPHENRDAGCPTTWRQSRDKSPDSQYSLGNLHNITVFIDSMYHYAKAVMQQTVNAVIETKLQP